MMKYDDKGFVIYEMAPRYNIEIPKSGQEKRRERRRDERMKNKLNHFRHKYTEL